MALEEPFFSSVSQLKQFQFSFVRLDVDNPMQGSLLQSNATEEELIDGKYLFKNPNRFIWTSDRDLLIMYTPMPSHNYERLAIASDGVRVTEPDAIVELLVQFTEIDIINLSDLDTEEFPSRSPMITTETLSNGIIWQEYNAVLTATGDTPMIWSLARGHRLPGGLELSEDGVISGAPTVSGIFEFAVNSHWRMSDDIGA